MKSLVFLGTGSSLGVPVIGCRCSVCSSNQLHNHRLRSSCLIDWDGKSFLIDAGPDLRQQCLRQNIPHLDGVLITHIHFDHVAGLDDLRIFSAKSRKPLPCLMLEESFLGLEKTYPYLFHPKNPLEPYFDCHLLKEDFGDFIFEGVPVRYVTYHQLGMKVCGFVLGGCAYISDIRDYSEELIHQITGIDTLILSAVRSNENQGSRPKAHLSLEEAIEFSQKVKAKKTFLTHLGHDVDYEETSKKLPPSISLAFDGLTVTLT